MRFSAFEIQNCSQTLIDLGRKLNSLQKYTQFANLLAYKYLCSI